MRGRLLIIGRLLVRDVRRTWLETALLVVAIGAATATLSLGFALNAIAASSYQQTRAATNGPDAAAEPLGTGDAVLPDLEAVANNPDTIASSGPFPIAYLMMSAGGRTVRTVVEGRDPSPAAVDQPLVRSGTWIAPGAAVVEHGFAVALGLHLGDQVTVDGRPLRVAGTAITASRSAYPSAGWRVPGQGVATASAGLIWVERSEVAHPQTYSLKVRIADPDASRAFTHQWGPGLNMLRWQNFEERYQEQNRDAQLTLRLGGWMLNVLSIAGVLGIVAGRIAGRRRRVGVLKALGAGPALIALVHLTEYLVIALTAAGAGLLAGWFTAPALFEPSAGLLGTSRAAPPPLQALLAAVELAVAIAAAATVVPVLRATATSTTHALADAAAPPRRRRWRVWLSRRLPTPLLLGVRINARRPRRARLVTVNAFMTMFALSAVLMLTAQIGTHPVDLGGAELPDVRGAATARAGFLVAAVICVLALFNTVVSTWSAVLDARHPLAVARALGATPFQAGTGLAVAQLLPALPGVAAGVPAGIGLYAYFDQSGGFHYATITAMLTTALLVILAIVALTAVPALLAARRPIATTLESA
ncbi:FtsX-like permease family protein [Dactylosporangium vinaceum]|uniref:FtsX-like permease family protein n=1 Tax=Dactylosporangium vinaceum TaxID=53362 RepID=A0ABV5MJN7_9ACTN|nr:FtsX-like permease family protein [Dactylosporangium vinaceum]UAB92631.1 FtsX-like permease family protein [Dactylosporangium vinaceum]